MDLCSLMINLIWFDLIKINVYAVIYLIFGIYL